MKPTRASQTRSWLRRPWTRTCVNSLCSERVMSEVGLLEAHSRPMAHRKALTEEDPGSGEDREEVPAHADYCEAKEFIQDVQGKLTRITLILVYKGCMNLKTSGIPYYFQNFDSFYPLVFQKFSPFFLIISPLG